MAFEAGAASVGTGIVLGGVALGIGRFATGSPRRRIERHALFDGYLGGVLGAAVAIVDLILRYGG